MQGEESALYGKKGPELLDERRNIHLQNAEIPTDRLGKAAREQEESLTEYDAGFFYERMTARRCERPPEKAHVSTIQIIRAL